MNAASKTKKCHYVGSVPVHKPSGMDVINAAIEKLANNTDRCVTGVWSFDSRGPVDVVRLQRMTKFTLNFNFIILFIS